MNCSVTFAVQLCLHCLGLHGLGKKSEVGRWRMHGPRGTASVA